MTETTPNVLEATPALASTHTHTDVCQTCPNVDKLAVTLVEVTLMLVEHGQHFLKARPSLSENTEVGRNIYGSGRHGSSRVETMSSLAEQTHIALNLVYIAQSQSKQCQI